ncbi:Nif3-like dinuclear metal center hexameric protein [Paraferrimonas sedimenticola]|uniref:GTP cyclohydrolase 1 type 2 homolog n=1 Tax=Paraferrimonas sedimenticola TaxID=375674 RepID=A0AA37W1E2_9GAMM|nr:Nif3-like dinuclear metal center hexameric protein [Paraferrimonas sedimenticola]GLP96132.1 GTP cyclohydrolase 1 type 2 [Paraferrimonas sedimenticola]
MSVSTQQLVQYIDELLDSAKFRDYAPNGLQVEGSTQVKTLVTGVTASQALIDKAVELNADAILVHHGFFWKGESPLVVGMKQRRLKALLTNNINLIGYHLPLDAHPTLGNNAQLASKLGIQNPTIDPSVKQDLLWTGELEKALSPDDFASLLSNTLNREPLTIAAGNKPIKRLAWCTGGAQDYIDQAAELGVDAFISGEASERTFHSAVEQGIHYFGAGHHATERYGIQALGEHLASQFELEWHHLDLSNPV